MAKPSYVWTGSEWLPVASAFPTAHQRIVSYESGTSLTLDVNDTGKALVFNNSNPVTVTIPDDSTYEFVVGQTFLLIQNGTGTVSVTNESSATLSSTVGTGTVDLNGQFATATLLKVEADEWVIYGDIV
jgi:hypothetical protein